MLSRRLRSEAGFSLVEMLVVMIGGLVVGAALLGIIDVTLHQSTNTFSRVDATGRARTTIESLVDELQSSCLSSGDTPIQPSSSDTSLIFTTQDGNAVSPTPVQHQITFSSSAGTLTETTTSGTRTLLTDVAQSGSTPVFQYFAYQEPLQSSGAPYTDADGNAYEMLLDGSTPVPGTSTIPTAQPLPVPLSTDTADSAAEVMITLAVGAAGGSNENTTVTTPKIAGTITDSAILRLSPVANHVGSGTTFGPCQ